MADTPYEFDVLDDFPDQAVDEAALQHQVEQSAIASAAVLFVESSMKGDPARKKCDVWFDDPLSVGDEAILDGIVAVHDGQPYIVPEVTEAPLAAQGFQLVTDTDQDSNVAIDRDSAGNMTMKDQNNPPRTLTELATAGQPDLSKVVLERDGSFVYIGDGDIITTR